MYCRLRCRRIWRQCLTEPAQAGTDCDDSDINVYPGSAAFEDSRSCVLDTDGDGYGESNPPSFYDIGNDCDDENSAIFPDAPERCFDESGQIDTLDKIATERSMKVQQ